MSRKPSGLYEWLFMDRRTGRIKIAQVPNTPALLFSASFAGAAIAKQRSSRSIAGRVAVVALTWWALGELLAGINPARRLMGASALAGVLALAVTPDFLDLDDPAIASPEAAAPGS